MKIKTWLLISYFIVMILPLLSAYFLFAWVISYHNDQKVEEYYEAYSEIQTVKKVLEDAALYEPAASKADVEAMASEELAIELYNADGIILYASNPNFEAQHRINKKSLYMELYELKQGLRSISYKEPVFETGQIIGFFSIEIARDKLVSTIIKRTWIVISIFVVSFILIYAAIAVLVNKRMNKRLYGLMDEMAAFASGNSYAETETGRDEIGELKEHFYAMRKQITAAREVIELEREAKEYMVATISHDLKTPLTSIKAYAESLDEAKGLTREEREQYRNVIIDKSDYMKQMLDDLITHTLLQSQNYELEMVTVDGEEFFDMIISDYEPLCEKKNIQLTACNNVKGNYDVNPKQLMRVADNLMMNAIQHTPPSGKVWIIALSEASNLEDWLYGFARNGYTFDFGKYAYLIVQNEGEGIPEENIPYLFDPLYQADQARSKKDASGTGLGLSITKQIIEKHGGEVAGLSELHIGACFICSIPKRGKE